MKCHCERSVAECGNLELDIILSNFFGELMSCHRGPVGLPIIGQPVNLVVLIRVLVYQV
jgi:hypothetical protein